MDRFRIPGDDQTTYSRHEVGLLVSRNRIDPSTIVIAEDGSEHLAGSLVPSAKPKPWFLIILGVCAISVPLFAIVAAVVFPVLAQARISAQQTNGMARLNKLSAALLVYATDFDDTLPPAMESAEVVHDYLAPYEKSPEVYSSTQEGNPTWGGNTGLAGTVTTTVKEPERTMTFYDQLPWANRMRIVSTLSGGTAKIRETEFQAAAKAGLVLQN